MKIGASPGIEPIATNAFLQKTLSGSHIVRNRHLKKLLAAKGQDTDEVWSSITLKKGFGAAPRFPWLSVRTRRLPCPPAAAHISLLGPCVQIEDKTETDQRPPLKLEPRRWMPAVPFRSTSTATVFVRDRNGQ